MSKVDEAGYEIGQVWELSNPAGHEIYLLLEKVGLDPESHYFRVFDLVTGCMVVFPCVAVAYDGVRLV